jgi:SAM-dependent methyltransferase
MKEQQYFIKDGYRPNLRAETFELQPMKSYWNHKRLRTSSIFQWQVYQACQKHLIAEGCHSLLEIGPGPATKTAMLLARHVEKLVLVDQPSLAEIIKQRLPQSTFLCANLETPDIELTESFDVVLCADVIEHLSDPDPCLDLIKSAIGPSGTAFISTPERDILRGFDCMTSPHPSHIREWNQSELAAYLQSRGFEILAHELLPQGKLSLFETLRKSLSGGTQRRPEWFGCQMAVVKLASPTANSLPVSAKTELQVA